MVCAEHVVEGNSAATSTEDLWTLAPHTHDQTPSQLPFAFPDPPLPPVEDAWMWWDSLRSEDSFDDSLDSLEELQHVSDLESDMSDVRTCLLF